MQNHDIVYIYLIAKYRVLTEHNKTVIILSVNNKSEELLRAFRLKPSLPQI